MNFLFKMGYLLCSPLGIWAPKKPIFDCGKQTLAYFIQSNLQYPSFSKQNCIQGIVLVSFQLGASGNVKNVRIKSGTGLDLDEEALRLIHLTQGKWQVTKNYDTTQNVEIPISFKLNSSSCQRVTTNQIEQAKHNYLLEQVLFQNIENFYKAKYSGKSIDVLDEKNIVLLKAQLGLDDSYFEEELALAKFAFKKHDVFTAKNKAFKIRNLGSTIADEFIATQGW